MKQSENNEIDLLLRGLARSERASSTASEEHSARHLDADEMNAYAEQALPDAARARYTSHLAECVSCRKIVSELTSAYGASVSEHTGPQKTAGGFWQKFGALLSPGVLRYAVPALALFAFVVVGLVVIRQRQPDPDLVAQNQPVASGDAKVETKEVATSPTEPAKVGEAVEGQRSSETQTSVAKSKDNQSKTGERSETANTAASPDSVVAYDKNTPAGKATGAVAQPSYAPEPAAPPPAKAQPTNTDARTEVAARQKEEDAKKDEPEPARDQEVARSRREDSQNRVATPQSGAATLAGGSQERLHKLEAKRSSSAGEKAKDDDGDTRTVSGRRFRRQGGIWVDTAYQSSTATTNLTRGSEQFRALVADEPGIRAIAAQLDGEVVFVWKGRAYRIR